MNNDLVYIAGKESDTTTNLSFTDKWPKLNLLPSGDQRYTLGDGWANSNAVLVSAPESFGYKGNSVQLSPTINSFLYFVSKEKIVGDDSFTGSVKVNVEIIASVARSIMIRIVRVTGTSTETPITSSAVTKSVPAGTRTLFSLPYSDWVGGTDISTIKGFNIRFYTGDSTPFTGTVTVGRLFISNENVSDDKLESQGDYPIIMRDTYRKESVSQDPIHIYGSSSVAGTFPTLLQNYLGRTIVRHGYAGLRQPHIRDGMIAADPSTYSMPHIFWVSRNTIGYGNDKLLDIAVNDLKRMINLLPHDKFLVISPQTIDDPTENVGQPAYEAIEQLDEYCFKAFKDRYIDIRKYLSHSFDFRDYRIAASYIQPTIGQNVTVTMNKSLVTPPQGEQRIMIGYNNNYDIYTVISTSTTAWTLRLDEQNRIAPGETVDNEPGASIAYISVIGERDYIDRINNRWPYSLRTDNTHLTDEGYGLLCKPVSDAIKQFNL